MVAAVKNKTGRPSKRTPETCAKIHILSRRGFTDKEIAGILDLDEATLTLWKRDPEFFTFLKTAKEVSDAIVTRSLYEKAVGYEWEEEEVVGNFKKGMEVQKVHKRLPPDTTACIFWLKNRQREEWRESPDSSGQKTVYNITNYHGLTEDQLFGLISARFNTRPVA